MHAAVLARLAVGGWAGASGLAALEPEANALDLELPEIAPASYGADPSVRKRLHYDSHRRRRGKPAS